MEQLSPVVDALIAEFEKSERHTAGATHLSVSRTVSIIAVLYEKVRNAVEFRAEHLVRRASIERILKRRILLNGGGSSIAENLLIELLWARYIDSSQIDDEKIVQVQRIIERYVAVKHQIYDAGHAPREVPWDTILGLASAEIEETLVSPVRREALNNFFYQAVRPKIQIAGHDEQYVNLMTFIAIERSFAQSDEPLVIFHLLKLVMPGWIKGEGENTKFIETIKSIKTSLKDPQLDMLSLYIRRQSPPLLLLRDFFFEKGDKTREVINDHAVFEQTLSDIAHRRYQETGQKIRRAIVRSFIYIFLTKMVFAFALEAPYDLYVAKNIDYIPLGINLLFPPILLSVVAGFISVPGVDNTKRLVERINKIIYEFDSLKTESDVFIPKAKTTRRPILTAVFTLIYIVMFFLMFFLIRLGLNLLHFNIVSQVIFIFFVALVTFFAYRIRQTTKEYEIVDRQGILEPLFDFIFLPVLVAGQLLSREITKLNIFIFLFDFILEAPLKVIFEVADEWVRFIRTKKEEIV